jgi:hypothetical protein
VPTQINTRLTYKMPSQPITISIPEPDARLTIRFVTPILSYARCLRYADASSLPASNNFLGRSDCMVLDFASSPRFLTSPRTHEHPSESPVSFFLSLPTFHRLLRYSKLCSFCSVQQEPRSAKRRSSSPESATTLPSMLACQRARTSPSNERS